MRWEVTQSLRTLQQSDEWHYFAVEVDSHSVCTDRWTESEATEIQRFCWWSLEEILTSTDHFRPANLAVLLPVIIAGDYPKIPIPVLVERGARTV